MTDVDYEKLYHQVPCGLVSTTVAGIVLDANDTFSAWTGLPIEQIVGRSFTSLLDAGSQIFFETRHTQILHLQGFVSEVALTLRRSDGSPLPVLLNSVLIRDQEPSVIRTAVFDATARLEYENELLRARRSAESSEARVRVLQDVSSLFGVSVSDEDVARAFAGVARDAFTATETAVMLHDDEGTLRVVAGVNPLVDLIPPIESLRNTPVEIVVHAQEAESQHPLLAAGLRFARLESLSVTPLMNESERLGVLVCFFGRRRDFDDHFFELQRALGRQASQTLVRVRLQRQLQHLALHDALTGLANRELLQREIDSAIEAAQTDAQPLAIIFLDVDEFKSVNDRWGHAAGDAVLHELAVRLTAGVRAEDVVARIGGDEFVVLCTSADTAAAASIADRILELTRHPLVVGGRSIRVSMSAGVTTYDPRDDPRPTGEHLLNRADAAMYRSKGTGKDRVTLDAAV
jgi:diguanylate cyclase (GGDEF)-like protein/PAS domain S-box-containing protein